MNPKPRQGGYTPRTSAGPTHSSSRRRPSPSPRQAHTESASPSQASFTAALEVETAVPLGSPLRPTPGARGQAAAPNRASPLRRSFSQRFPLETRLLLPCAALCALLWRFPQGMFAPASRGILMNPERVPTESTCSFSSRCCAQETEAGGRTPNMLGSKTKAQSTAMMKTKCGGGGGWIAFMCTCIHL